MNGCPSINPFQMSRPMISNTIGSVNRFGEIRGIDNRLIGTTNRFGDVKLNCLDRPFARLDSFGTLRTGINQTPVGSVSGSLPGFRI